MAAYRWRERHVLHKLGSVGLVPATLLFVVGFSVPAWRLGVGLWTRCQFEVCISDVSHNSTPMLYAVLTSECVALFLFLLSLCATVYQEFYKNPAKPDDRLVEVSATAAGVFSMTGVVIYGVEVGDIRHLDWGYGLVISASLLALLSALLIACTRHKDASLESPSNSSSFSMATRQGREQTSIEGHPMESMMLVHSSGSGVFPTGSMPRGRAPPPYSLPPPYPYHPECGYILQNPGTTTMTPQITATSGTDSFGVPYTDGRLSPASIDLQCQGHPVTPQVPTFYTTAQADVVPLYVDSLTRQSASGMRTNPRLPSFTSKQ
ncbi:hypothetical protein BaRGS_00030970 [Batillaria attramentaria]|uniref:Uncharacterized protein n=1 Tax=Batillaria attramentaria TaxID=370345 RepID=A0ABD0JS14_9CAEN